MKLTMETLHMYCDDCGDCMRWKLSVNSAGCPQARLDGKSQLVKRWIWSELLGKKLNGNKTRVVSSCGDMLCVNPRHLASKTYSQVLIDTYDRGGRNSASDYIKRLERVKNMGATKMDWEKVRELRASGMSARQAAERYGIGERTAYKIIKHQSWIERMPGASVFDFAMRSAA